MVELITGGDGTAHISSADDGALNAAIVGAGSYVSQGVGAGLTLTISDANHLVIGTGCGFHEGRGFRVESDHEVQIRSGSQMTRRWDKIVLRYSCDADGVESADIVAIPGEAVSSTGSKQPAYPAHETGSVLAGAKVSDMPLWGVKVNGITIEGTERLFRPFEPLVGHHHDAGDVASGTLSVARGGTGATSLQSLRKSMGLGDTTGVLPIANGGTGASTAQAALDTLTKWNSLQPAKIELRGGGQTTSSNEGGYIDFHWKGSTADNTSRIIEDAEGQINVNGFKFKRNDGWGALNSMALKSWLLNYVYKVGYIWISYVNTSPASIVGGTWTQITGRFLYANGNTSTGGSNTHTLSVNEMPSHAHSGKATPLYLMGNGSSPFGYVISGNTTLTITEGRGGSQAHNNMPAYQSVYCWRRTG